MFPNGYKNYAECLVLYTIRRDITVDRHISTVTYQP